MPYEINNPEVLAVFGSGLLLNVVLAVVLTLRGKAHALLWAFSLGLAVSFVVAWSLGWHGGGWDTVKAVVLFAVLGLPLGLATFIMRVAVIVPFFVRAVIAFLVGLVVAPLLPPLGLMLVCGLTGDCP
jgi:hypothetical protein